MRWAVGVMWYILTLVLISALISVREVDMDWILQYVYEYREVDYSVTDGSVPVWQLDLEVVDLWEEVSISGD